MNLEGEGAGGLEMETMWWRRTFEASPEVAMDLWRMSFEEGCVVMQLAVGRAYMGRWNLKCSDRGGSSFPLLYSSVNDMSCRDMFPTQGCP
jgi:hypothetical protein